MSILVEGWLKKQGRQKKVMGVALKATQNDRYFILRSTAELQYFHEMPSCSNSLSPPASPSRKARTSPRDSLSPRQSSKNLGGDGSVINLYKTVVTGLSGNRISIASEERTFLLTAPTEDNWRIWLTALQQVVAHQAVSVDDFELLMVVGEGGFGKVFKVKNKLSGSIYAMKVIEKRALRCDKDIEDVLDEKNFMQMLDHPFIVKLHYTFQSTDKLYMVMDFLGGGECYTLMRKYHFPEDVVKIHAAQLSLALDYLHGQDVLYRDLKPENCVLDERGNMVLTDFGLSKRARADKTRKTRVGTPDYMAPEVTLGQAYTKAVDWWALGCLIFELTTGRHPFLDKRGRVPPQSVLKDPPNLDDTQGVRLSHEFKDIVRKFLNKNHEERLQDLNDIKRHPWFNGMDWDGVYNKQLCPSWRPATSDDERFDPAALSQKPELKPSAPGRDFEDFAWSRDE